jgi:phosphoglycerate dehydrogenase-like enzyme
MEAKVAIAPVSGAFENHSNAFNRPEVQAKFAGAVRAGGGTVVPVDQANVLIWTDIADVSPLVRILDDNPSISWVQFPWTGVEKFVAMGILDRPLTFTSAKGLYGGEAGEHTFGLILACLRGFTEHARSSDWYKIEPEGLEGKRVTVLGAGGIATRVVRFLEVAGSYVTVLRRSDGDVPHADRTLPIFALHDVLPETDILVIALSLTSETHGIIGEKELALLPANAVLVNVARGVHVDQDAMVEALRSGQLKAAGLDVTEPEPLPADHPLWSMNNVLITSHSANSLGYTTAKLAGRIERNVASFVNGDQLEGLVVPEAEY